MRAYHYTRFTIFHLLNLLGSLLGLYFGLRTGLHYFHLPVAILCSILGLITGMLLGAIPRYLAEKSFWKEITQSPDSRLLQIIQQDRWNFRQTMALLQLSTRGHDVQPHLPRILSMLESESPETRAFGFDALRIVYTELANQIPTYDPSQSAEKCRAALAPLLSSMMK
jgi:hypothetical protein